MSLNLTPMIDVVFLLLFFFLTVSRFKSPEGMLAAQLPPPDDAVAVEIPREPIRIRIEPAIVPGGPGMAVIEHLSPSAIPLPSLAARLEEIRDSIPGFDTGAPVILLAGDNIPWEHVVNAYNAAMAAQYHRIFFAEAPP